MQLFRGLIWIGIGLCATLIDLPGAQTQGFLLSQAWGGPLRVLMTSFEKFGGESDNASRAMVAAFEKSLHEKPLSQNIELFTEVLPVVYGKAEERLLKRVNQAAPDLVISLGQSGQDWMFELETKAYNEDDSDFADNEGQVRLGQKIVDGGPDFWVTGLPLGAIKKAIVGAGFRVQMSSDPGRYLCNHIFYHLMNQIRTQPRENGAQVMAGFIHVPSNPDPDVLSYRDWGEKNAPALRAMVEASIMELEKPSKIRIDINHQADALNIGF